MKLLVCGGSDIFFRRVLPALPGLGVAAVEVASRSGRRAPAETPLPVTYADDALAALERSPADAVYVSTENSRHAALALAALESGRHVVVDKPAFLDLPTAERAAELAAKKGLVLAEATVWADHPRVAAIRDAFAAAGSEPTRLSVVFSFPPLPAGNFRHDPSCGGGALPDLGPYAVSPARVFFGAAPDNVTCRILARGEAVETAFCCLLTFPGGKSLAATCGFDTGYANRLDVLGPGLAAAMDRAFTPPPGAALPLHLNAPAGARTETIPPADAFAAFFGRAFAAMDKGAGAGDGLREDLLADARALAMLRKSASGGQEGMIPSWTSPMGG
ncbi:Gfo/Idh/MocA family protein [Solidesulfovibrio sp.]|uniref:Gfo/Idh/MocA family protein n=1 Tax=Solidesulfovibrio sp. TaxID=2910990 RepID=UPI002B20E9A2|nr:Gfo/Idh/MocA family oxidoreductase [Solidesulfovibrio sp.]MEA4856496.1 Gfo/Idh/MocA family oxidoreductase [Solidesulfovibrio sp.]